MLRELGIQNFALIEALRLPLSAGLTVLTGETGAGKSIIIDALGALLGEPVGAEVIRPGAPHARVEGVFEASPEGPVAAALAESGLQAEEDGVVILARQIAAERSAYWVNGRPATRALVREIGRLLVDIHGQHQHQTLLHEAHHLDFVDVFGRGELTAPRAAYLRAYLRYTELRQELARLREAERDRAQRVDLLGFQVRELQEADLDEQADEALPQEHRRLAHAESLREAAGEALGALEEEWGEGAGAGERVAQAARALQAAAQFDPALEPLVAELHSAEAVLRETARSLADYAQRLDFDPARLAQVERRLGLLEQLKRKYGGSVGEMLAYARSAQAELEELQSLDLRREELSAELERARAAAGEAAARLSDLRQEQARRLEQVMEVEIRRLGMEQGRFAVQFERRPDPEGLPDAAGERWGAEPEGWDEVRFLLSANAGEPLRPLSQVASGGELSRLMLAFKAICAEATAVPVLVFDEIDVGIGGRTAHAVAAKLTQVAAEAQVLCVTHLPQIASLAHQQVQVSKQVREGRSLIIAQSLPVAERAVELARMMGAAEDEAAALEHARRMLARAEQQRSQPEAAPAAKS